MQPCNRSASGPDFEHSLRSSAVGEQGHPWAHHQTHEGQVTTEASTWRNSWKYNSNEHAYKAVLAWLVAGACACLELLAHLEPWQEQTLPLRRHMGLAHSNLPQKLPLCHHPPQPEVAFVHVVS